MVFIEVAPGVVDHLVDGSNEFGRRCLYNNEQHPTVIITMDLIGALATSPAYSPTLNEDVERVLQTRPALPNGLVEFDTFDDFCAAYQVDIPV